MSKKIPSEQLFLELTFQADVNVQSTGLSIYRRLVRNTLFNVIRQACPRAQTYVGEDLFQELIATYLEEAILDEPIYWMIPVQFGQWVFQTGLDGTNTCLNNNPALAELILWETIEIEVLNAPEGRDEMFVRHITPGSQVELVEHVRLIQFKYDVFRTDQSSNCPALKQPEAILIYRQIERMFWRLLSPIEAAIIGLISEGHAPQAISALLNQNSIASDLGFVMAFCQELACKGLLKNIQV